MLKIFLSTFLYLKYPDPYSYVQNILIPIPMHRISLHLAYLAHPWLYIDLDNYFYALFMSFKVQIQLQRCLFCIGTFISMF